MALRDIWYGFHRTGALTTMVRHYIGLAKASNADTTIDPFVYVRTTPFGGSFADSDELHYSENDNAVTLVAPEDIKHGHIDVLVDPDTEYELRLLADGYARPVYWTAMEFPQGTSVEDTDDGVMSPAPYLLDAPIYYQNIDEALDTTNLLWRLNGCHLLSWSGPVIAAGNQPFLRAANTYGQNTMTHDFVLGGFEFHRRRSKNTVPIVFAARGDTENPATNGVELVDADDLSQLAELTDFGTDVEWKRVEVEIPYDTRAVRVRSKGDGSEPFRLHAFSAFEYSPPP
jgi:hypothetical protein